MTLPTTTTLSDDDHCEDDSDMFGPPRSAPPLGFHHHRSRVPMISPKLRQREERKRILQLCAHKLERIKDSETNLRRSVCINNTYCRLTDELRREKQSRYLANQPKSDTKPETARDNIFSPYNSCGIDSSNHQPSLRQQHQHVDDARALFSSENQSSHGDHHSKSSNNNINNNFNSGCNTDPPSVYPQHHLLYHNNNNNNDCTSPPSAARKHKISSSNLDTDLENLDRELNAINAPMPLIDPEITQGAQQLEKAISSRKRLRSEDESDRLVREALSQFYIPPQRLISAIEDCPLDVVSVSAPSGNHHSKRAKLNSCGGADLELDFDMSHQSQKEFEVIMDALRLGSPSPTPSVGSDSCGQAAMMGESGVFHNLVVTSLET